MTNTLRVADITWQTDHLGNTVPVSHAFDDVYFSHSGGIHESHYVFIEGNDLADRLAKLGDRQTFVVAETGFGTGLNFLALCKFWATLKQNQQLNPGARLYFISTEKFPLSQEDLRTALAAWQGDEQIQHFIHQLIHQYPLPLAGCQPAAGAYFFFSSSGLGLSAIFLLNHQANQMPIPIMKAITTKLIWPSGEESKCPHNPIAFSMRYLDAAHIAMKPLWLSCFTSNGLVQS